MTNKVTPGSPDAISNGCKCPATLNNDGDGIVHEYGSLNNLYYVNSHCPIHSVEVVNLVYIPENSQTS